MFAGFLLTLHRKTFLIVPNAETSSQICIALLCHPTSMQGQCRPDSGDDGWMSGRLSSSRWRPVVSWERYRCLVQFCVTDDSVSLNLRGPFRGGEAIFTPVDQRPRVLGRSAENVRRPRLRYRLR